MIRNNFLILLTLILAAIPGITEAGTPEEIEAQMDRIKLDETLINGEDFSDNKDMAYGNALAELLVTANELRAEDQLHPLQASDLKPPAKELCYKKGVRHVVMLYMPRRQALDLSLSESATPVPQQPAPPAVAMPPSSRTATPATDEIIDTLCRQDNWIEIKGFLTGFKQEGKITASGAVDSASKIPADAYSILLDEYGGILAILSPKDSGQMIDYRTNRVDNASNHSNCKFIF